MSTAMNGLLLVFNCFLMAIGNCVGPIVMRLYFVHGGNCVWLSSWLETGGWPIIFIPLIISYFQRRRTATVDDPSGSGNSTKMVLMKPRLLLSAVIIGVITGFDDYMYAYGMYRLPVSTAALIIACQLAFTAVFAFLLVKQKFTSYSINTVVLLTIGGVVLALHTSGDRPAGETNKQYITGFLMTVGAAVVYGLLLPLVELAYSKARQKITYTLVLEFQMVLCLFATIVCTFGMLINNDFQVIPKEAAEFGLGEKKYYVILVLSAIIWQGFYLGAVGIIFCSSSLLSAIVIAALLPVTEILAVIVFREKFRAEKGVSLALNLWGFVSYFYGEIKHDRKNNSKLELQQTDHHDLPTSQITNV